MKTASNNLISLLQTSNQFYMAELYTITLANNTALRYTTLDSDVSWNGNNFASQGLLLKRSRITQAVGLETSELEIEAMPTNATIGNVGFLAAARNGALDGAFVKLERLFYPSWGSNATGGITLFYGLIGEVYPITRAGATINVKSIAELLDVPWPYMTYQPGCVWRLYGNGCGLNKTSWTVNGNATAGGNISSFGTNLTQANNYFDLGVISFNSGNLAGVWRTIKSFAHTGGNMSLVLPLPEAPAGGATFTTYPGCDRQKTTCANKNNSNNFRGFPFIPSPEVGI